MKYLALFFAQSLFLSHAFCSYADIYPLHSAIYKNDPKAFKIALHNNADVNMVDDDNKTPLYIAIMKNNMWFVDRLIQQKTLTIDSKALDSIFWGIQVFPNNATSFHNLICSLPDSTKIEFSPILYETFSCIFGRSIQTNSEEIIRQSLQDLLNTKLISFNSLRYFRYPSIFRLITHTDYDKSLHNLYLSLIKAGHSLNDSDLYNKRPIDYAYQKRNIPMIVAILEAGSFFPSKINLKNDLPFIKKELKKSAKNRLSETKNRLMITSTIRFTKNQQLGKRAISRNLRINKKSRAQRQEFNRVTQELANIEID